MGCLFLKKKIGLFSSSLNNPFLSFQEFNQHVQIFESQKRSFPRIQKSKLPESFYFLDQNSMQKPYVLRNIECD